MEKMYLKEIFSKYDSRSLATAIYTITSWIPNRKYVGLVDVINREFLLFEETYSFGNEQITSYEEFQSFFIETKNILSDYIIYVEDFTPDIGEVRFCHEEEFYKIFIANGSENIYECCFLISQIVENNERLKRIWKEILLYEDHILSTIYAKKWECSDTFEVPICEYFEIIKEKYLSFENPILKDFFQDIKSYNTELYAFFSKQEQYPIFIPMLKEVFLEKVEQELSQIEYRNAIWNSLVGRIRNNYYLKDYRDKKTLYPIGFMSKNHKIEFISNNAFILVGEKECVVFYSECISKVFQNKTIQKLAKQQTNMFGLSITGETVGLKNSANRRIMYQKVSDTSMSPNVTKMSFLSTEEDASYITAVDLIGIFNFSTDIEEIIEFIRYVNNKNEGKKLLCFSGTLSLFHAWKDMDKVIVEGALSPTVIVPPYQSVEKVIDFFRSFCDYSFTAKTMFSEIHSWNEKEDTRANLSLVSKDNSGSADIFTFYEKKIIYYEHHFISEDIDIKMVEGLMSIHEVIENALCEYKEIILTKYCGSNLELNFVSERILMENANANSKEILESKYCKKILVNESEGTLVLLIKPYWEKILEDNISCNEKKFENELILSLLNGVSFENVKEMEDIIVKSNTEKRTSSVSELEIRYFVEPTLRFSVPQLVAFKNVRKLMAKVIKKMGLLPGTYEESKILGIVRQFRNEFRNELVEKLKKFNNLDMHKKLLDIYSTILF